MHDRRRPGLVPLLAIATLIAACSMGGDPPTPTPVADVEPNGTTAGADANTVIPSLPAQLSGTLTGGNVDAVDLFRLNLPGETTLLVQTTCTGNVPTIGILNQLYTAPCNGSTTWGDIPGGTAYIRIESNQPDPGTGVNYTITLTPQA